MFNKEKGLEAKIKELSGTIKTMLDVAAINKRKHRRAKRDHDKASKELEKELTKSQKEFIKAQKGLNKLKFLLDIERLAELEHEQWVAWSQAVADEVSEERRARWETLWIPYDELPEGVKDQDRVWARKILGEVGDEITN